MLKKGYLSFQSSQSRMPCTFLYPAGWDVREIVQDGYVEIFILGPVSRAGTYSTSVSVGVTRAAGQTPLEAANVLVSKYRAAFKAQERGPFSVIVAGRPAVEVEISYSMLLPLNSLNAKLTPIRERRIFFEENNQLFELDYLAPEEDYETWLGAFRTLVDSFAFPEKPAIMPSYRPVVTAVPQHAREESLEYEAKESQNDGEPEHNQGRGYRPGAAGCEVNGTLGASDCPSAAKCEVRK